MRLALFMLRNARTVTIISIVVGFIAGICNTAVLALISVALGNIHSPAPALIWTFVGLCALMLVSRIVSESLLLRVSQKAVYDLRMKLSRRILAAPLRHLEELGAHRLLATLMDDIPVIGNTVIIFPVVCMQVAIVVGVLFYMGWISIPLLMWVLGFMLIGIITYRIPLVRGLRQLTSARELRDSLFNHMRALTGGTKELKMHWQRRQAFLSENLGAIADGVRRHNVAGLTFYIAANSWGQILFFIVIGLLLFVLPSKANITVQDLTGYIITLLYMMTPLQVILNNLPEIGRANIALQKIDQLGLSLAVRSTENEFAPQPAPVLSWESIDLVGVTCTYYVEQDNSSFTLGPLNLTIKPGEQIFITGGNGCGKTTLAKLLTGLYIPESGDILLNGQPVTDENRERYRHYFSVVFSDFYLFQSLLGLVKPELDVCARQYLAKLRLDPKVQVNNGVLSTTDLSQGQRKRLALLTAYLEDRPIYVFDEWAADQDPMFKETFYRQILLDLQLRGKTLLVISHDDKYYDLADRVIKLEYGKIESDTRINDTQQTTHKIILPARDN